MYICEDVAIFVQLFSLLKERGKKVSGVPELFISTDKEAKINK